MNRLGRSIACLLLFATMLMPPGVRADARAGTFAFGGLDRAYRLYRPPSLARDRAVPLVVMLHGGFGTAQQAESAYHWDAQADQGNFVVLYPDGLGRAWNAGACCGRPARQNVDDVGFITALIRAISKNENIDTHRIYVTGMSNGAMMAYRMACESPLAIAAIGPVAGTFSKPCDRPQKTSVLAIHGSADPLVPYQGGSGRGVDRSPRPAVPQVLAAWRATDGCSAPVQTVSGAVTDEVARCQNAMTVELITVAGAGHQWPGGRPTPSTLRRITQQAGLGEPSKALDATTTLWKFFSAHRAG